MAWTVEFYATSNGREPVYDYIRGQSNPERSRIERTINTIQAHGIEAVDTKHLEGKVWEIRIHSKVAHRIFYVTVQNQTIVLLHAITKKTQKTPVTDRQLAVKRSMDVLGK